LLLARRQLACLRTFRDRHYHWRDRGRDHDRDRSSWLSTYPPWKVASASENARAVSTRPGSAACAFSLRTSDTPERREPMSSVGTSSPRAFALSSTCLGERISAFMTSS